MGLDGEQVIREVLYDAGGPKCSGTHLDGRCRAALLALLVQVGRRCFHWLRLLFLFLGGAGKVP